MLDKVYTEATPRLVELHKNYNGRKSGKSDSATYFDNTNAEDETGYFSATKGDSNSYWEYKEYTHLSEQQFIDFMELGKYIGSLNTETDEEVDYLNIAEEWSKEGEKEEVFNPQPHYDNSKGSLYKVATDLNLNHWEFDIFKRLVRCRKKEQFKQDLQKIKDTIDIYIEEYDRGL